MVLGRSLSRLLGRPGLRCVRVEPARPRQERRTRTAAVDVPCRLRGRRRAGGGGAAARTGGRRTLHRGAVPGAAPSGGGGAPGAGAARRDAPPVGEAVLRQPVADAGDAADPGGRQDVLHAGARQEVPLLARAGRGGVAPPCGATRARVDSRRPGTELAAARPRPLRRHPAAGAGRGARLHHPAERSRAHRGRLRRRVANPAGHRARPDAGHGLAPGGRRAAGVACRNPLPEARIQPPSDAWGAPGPSVPSARPARARCPGDWARPQASAAAPRWCPT